MVPIPINDALAMIPTSGLPVGLPVIGDSPVFCSDVALPTGSLPDLRHYLIVNLLAHA